MKTSVDNQDPRFINPEWDFLAEYPLNELLVDLDLRDTAEAGILFQAFLSLGIQSELLDIIERKLIGFVAEGPAQLNQRRFEAPTFVRLFFQRQTVAGLPTLRASSQGGVKHTTKSSNIIDHPGPETNGGWGYFLVERGADSKPGASQGTKNWVDLYIYKEGG